MTDQITVQLAPLSIAPLKKKSLIEMIWEAIHSYVWFGVGVGLGWLLWGMG